MYKDVLRSIEDVGIFPVIAFVIFFTFFLGLLVYVIRMDKNEVRQLAAIPMEDETSTVTGNTQASPQP